ncbi:protein adenylyltransferase SelO [Ferrimonas marina]|uniref:Protein nucleotidyltransferase YdiU n=1 Tax=Ferrimonas marina TaxID=299255 RepID=A0A1M5N6P9_9GAMM|nr:protein adenylyltransferase SelO family protein [Ferrimonas marina]SHG85266.1 Uncharacterized conserved protein YdiU, UPF0061 family [Ferrimonas marina]
MNPGTQADKVSSQAHPDSQGITTLAGLANLADFSLREQLTCDPDASPEGEDWQPRQVFSGHYVPVKPTPIESPVYVAHSSALFAELGLDDSLAQTPEFTRVFSGDLSQVPEPMLSTGWATGYSLSIFGTEYIQQCPFQTGNGYGDGRALSVLELVSGERRWELQLKGAGPTPYCRGGDGRAVLRSSVREFLAQELMHALGVPTSRSFSLFASQTETVNRPWYIEGSHSEDPDTLVANPVAITTRVAPSFLRVGQLELFSRRARTQAHPQAMAELEQITRHIIAREYGDEIDSDSALEEQVLALATAFRGRLTSLVSHWIRVGFCQGNFNSDNCAVGGFTLDYGPFGFNELFDPYFQPWTGGGRHFSFFFQPQAAEKNFHTFCDALKPLLTESDARLRLAEVRNGFEDKMQQSLKAMWAAKLGLAEFDGELLNELLRLMMETEVDYTRLFRLLSELPSEPESLIPSFYGKPSEAMLGQWGNWLTQWRRHWDANIGDKQRSAQMKGVNPKYSWREWLVVPAYQRAEQGDYSRIHALQALFAQPYQEQSDEVSEVYDRLRPPQFFHAGGVSHYSCSS